MSSACHSAWHAVGAPLLLRSYCCYCISSVCPTWQKPNLLKPETWKCQNADSRRLLSPIHPERVTHLKPGSIALQSLHHSAWETEPLWSQWLEHHWTWIVVAVQSPSRVRVFVIPWSTACQASLYFTISQSLLKLISIMSAMSFNHLILCHPLLLLPSIFPASRSFPVTHFFASGDQSIGASALASVLPVNIQSWFPLGSSCSPRDSQKSSPAPQFETINFSELSLLYGPTLTSIHNYWKNHSFDYTGKVMSLLLNMLSRFIIVFLPSSKHLLISWLQSPSAVILESQKIKSHCFHFFPFYLPWSKGTKCHDLSFLNVEF